MSKIIYTDIDLTLLDFNSPLEEFMRENGHIVTGKQIGRAHV